MVAEPPPAATAPAQVLRRYTGTHASQGAAVDARFVYAVSNSTIVKHDKGSGSQAARWAGDAKTYPHINACTAVTGKLLCASSNYPATPMRSAVLTFDAATMRLESVLPLADAPGSITWIDRHAGRWWVGFANYDGKGGEPGRDHTHSAVVTYDDAWRPVKRWSFPKTVLDRFAPHSTSGGGWGDDGRLYVTGHDKPELYALAIPKTGAVLDLVATIPVAVEGQSATWDRSARRTLYGVSRRTGEIVVMRVPTLP